MEVAGVGEAPPLIIPVDLGGGDWLEPVTGAAGMGWSGSCRRGSGAGSLEFDIWSCDSRLMVIWRAAMSWGRMAAVLQLSDLRHHFRRPQRPLQGRLAASLAAAGPLQCRYTRPPFNGAAALKCFFLSSSFLFSSCVVLNKNKKYYRVAMSIRICFTLVLQMRDWRWLKRGLIKVLHFNYSKFCCVN